MDLNVLNEMQKLAVTTTEGPVMVMAGAGSGKTRVLTYRIAYLIESLGIDPYNILAVTFTNKAANEMKERVEKLLDMNVKNLWISTFHSFCARFLRREIYVLGKYRPNFIIIGEDDALKILKEEMKDKDFHLTSKDVMYFISLAKNDEALPKMDNVDRSEFDTIYSLYQEHLVRENLLDFDDLISLTVHILEEFLPIREKSAALFNYIMIDEFQDTSILQWQNFLPLVHNSLSEGKMNLLVGDAKQAIYRFRSGEVEQIIKLPYIHGLENNPFKEECENTFKENYDPCLLKSNYRSKKNNS